MTEKLLLVGLDGGATKISGWTIDLDIDQFRFSLGSTNIQKSYRDYPEFDENFKSADIKLQLNEYGSGTISPGKDEIRQSRAYTQACNAVIAGIASEYPGSKLLLGLGMPGLKTSDQRGIAVLLNGPRIPDYAATVEAAVEIMGIDLAAPIFRIGSDADYCGIGEEYSDGGGFKKTENAYYLGGGTGTADALKLNGSLMPLDQTKTWLAKTWEMKNDKDISLERYSSAGGIQSIYSTYSGISIEDLNIQQVYPDQILKRALAGESAALDTYNDISHYLAQLLFERISTIYSGWKNNFEFMNPNRDNLESDHPFQGTLLSGIIIGQRLGTLLESSRDTALFYKPLMADLAKMIADSDLAAEFKDHYLVKGEFNPDLITSSNLREAPAMGAAIDAYLNFKKRT